MGNGQIATLDSRSQTYAYGARRLWHNNEINAFNDTIPIPPATFCCQVPGQVYRERLTVDHDQRTAQADIRRLAARYDGDEKADEAVRDRFSKQHRISYRLPIRRVYADGFE